MTAMPLQVNCRQCNVYATRFSAMLSEDHSLVLGWRCKKCGERMFWKIPIAELDKNCPTPESPTEPTPESPWSESDVKTLHDVFHIRLPE